MLHNIEKTGECFLPDKTDAYELRINLERYMFAMQFVKDKVVLDAACGSGLGTYLYSMLAKKVIAVDHQLDHLTYAKSFPYKDVEFIQVDLDKQELPEVDITISLETIEHLKDPHFFLKNLKSKELVFSIPLNALGCSQYHFVDIKTLDDIKALIEPYYKVEDYFIQANRWVYGKGTRK